MNKEKDLGNSFDRYLAMLCCRAAPLLWQLMQLCNRFDGNWDVGLEVGNRFYPCCLLCSLLWEALKFERCLSNCTAKTQVQRKVF